MLVDSIACHKLTQCRHLQYRLQNCYASARHLYASDAAAPTFFSHSFCVAQLGCAALAGSSIIKKGRRSCVVCPFFSRKYAL
jgi:hypothetical protein